MNSNFNLEKVIDDAKKALYDNMSVNKFLRDNNYIKFIDNHYPDSYSNTFYFFNTFLFLNIRVIINGYMDCWHSEIPYSVISPNYFKSTIFSSDYRIYINDHKNKTSPINYIITKFKFYFDNQFNRTIIKLENMLPEISLLSNQEFYFFRNKNYIDHKHDHLHRESANDFWTNISSPTNDILKKDTVLFYEYNRMLDTDIFFYPDCIKIIIKSNYFNIRNLKDLQFYSDNLPKNYFFFAEKRSSSDHYYQLYQNFYEYNHSTVKITDNINTFEIDLILQLRPNEDSWLYRFEVEGDMKNILEYSINQCTDFYLFQNTIIQIDLRKFFLYSKYLPNTNKNRNEYYYKDNSSTDDDTDIYSDNDDIDKHGLAKSYSENYYSKRIIDIQHGFNLNNNKTKVTNTFLDIQFKDKIPNEPILNWDTPSPKDGLIIHKRKYCDINDYSLSLEKEYYSDTNSDNENENNNSTKKKYKYILPKLSNDPIHNEIIWKINKNKKPKESSPPPNNTTPKTNIPSAQSAFGTDIDNLYQNSTADSGSKNSCPIRKSARLLKKGRKQYKE